MSLRPRVLKFLGLLLVACLALGATAGAASAKRYTAKQKQAIGRQLLKQIKKHPKLLRSKSFVRKASAVNFQLPVTIRLNPDLVYPNVLCGQLGLGAACAGPATFPALGGLANSDDTAILNLGQSLGGSKAVKLGGQVEAYVDFKSPLDGGSIGDVDIVFKDTSANPTATPPLEVNPVSVLTNPDVWAGPEAKDVENGGCTDRATSPYFGGVFSPLDVGVPLTESGKAPLHYSGSADADYPPNMPFMNTSDTDRMNTVLRASGPVTASNPAGNLQVGINATKSGGFANILGAGPSQVKLALDLNIWTVIRGVDAERGNGLGPFGQTGPLPNGATTNRILDPYDTNCREAWSGYTHNLLHAVTGGDAHALRIAPSFTHDRRLRIAKIHFGSTGVTTHNTVRACLQPFSPYVKQGSPVAIFPFDFGTPTNIQDDVPFPLYGTNNHLVSLPGEIASQLALDRSLVQPAPGTTGGDPAGTGGHCDNYPADTASHPNIATDGSQLSLPFPGPVCPVPTALPCASEAPAPGTAATSPWFARYPYNFHRAPGIEAATCSYDSDGQPIGAATGQGTGNTGPGAICNETGIQNSAIIDADVTVENLTAEVLVGHGIPSGPNGPPGP